MKRLALALLAVMALYPIVGLAQERQLEIATVTRPPFSMALETETGFSLDLWAALAADIGLEYRVTRYDGFSDMLNAVKDGRADLAIANISITAAREQVMDFSQPIYASGLQIMTPLQSGGPSLLSAILSKQLVLSVALAFGALLGVGMLMWWLERRRQAYFDRPAKEAVFPAFWWALNLVVNGGFEERVPQSPLGRVLSVILVVVSLFFVSVFVAYVTSVMTVEAIVSNVQSTNDLYGKRIGTINQSTAATYLEGRDIHFRGFEGLEALLQAFEDETLDAVVFDEPILSYYVNTKGQGAAELAGPVFLRENYGIAAPTDSALIEPINQSLLRLRENGTYADLHHRWFGRAPH